MKLVSWNVNGIRAAAKKGFFEWLNCTSFDAVCLQETKAQPDQLDEKFLSPEGYFTAEYNSAQRKGYSGVADFFTEKLSPTEVNYGFDLSRFDKAARTKLLKDHSQELIDSFNSEGRVIESHHKVKDLSFVLFNIYFPNGGASEERLDFKMKFYDFYLKYLDEYLKLQPNIIITGDFNTAHHEIDLARPKDNLKTSGFMPMERERLDSLEELGFFDSFRAFNSEPDNYTWWSFRTAARKRNVGWRIDYFYVSKNLKPYVKNAEILSDVMGSDHCPVSLELKV